MNKGFTMVEILAVIIILAGIMLIAVPAYNEVAASVRASSLENKTKAIVSSMEQYANNYLLDQIKPPGDCIGLNACCRLYDLYTYIALYGIYSTEDTIDGEPFIVNPKTNDKLYGSVEIRYDREKYLVKGKFIEAKIVNGEANCGE